jgi:c(7)-type cytochrome triheme protein
VIFNKFRSSVKQTSAPIGALVVFLSVFFLACSHKSLSLFLDVPPPKSEPEVQESEESAQQGSEQAQVSYGSNQWNSVNPADLETDRPAIEDTLVWEEALELLPRNKKGEPDWSAALQEGIIKPRALDPADRMVEMFDLDFYIKADKPKFDAWFPHSSHLKWMGCNSCHSAVFKYRDNEITMKAIRKGEYCGACHGKVAFTAKDCKRCHTQM